MPPLSDSRTSVGPGGFCHAKRLGHLALAKVQPCCPFLSFLKTLSVYAYPLLFAGSCFKVLVPVAIFVLGEFFFYAGGILSAAGYLSIWVTLAVCIAGGYVGDICSFYIGKRYAARMERALESWRIFHDVYDSGREFMAEHGDRAVFLARFLGPAAWVTHLASRRHWLRDRNRHLVPAGFRRRRGLFDLRTDRRVRVWCAGLPRLYAPPSLEKTLPEAVRPVNGSPLRAARLVALRQERR